MNILMLITQLGYGGAESAFVRLARELAKRHTVDIAVFVEGYGTEGYAEIGLPSDLQIHRLDPPETHGRIARWLGRRRELARLRRSLSTEATISFLSGPNLLNSVSPGPGLKLVSVRGSRRYDAHASLAQRLCYCWLIDPLTHWFADAVVCVSQGLALEIGDRRAASLQGKVRAISGYVDADALISAVSAPVETELEPLAELAVIAAAGRLSPEKGFQHLIRVFAGVRCKVAGARLLIVGDGPYRQRLEEDCRGLGLTFGPPNGGFDVPDVIFLGFRDQPHRYFRLARSFALPSSSEGFPNILVEALAAGVAVAAADVPWGAREVLRVPADPQNRPFPRAEPHETPFGFLLPRIDDRRFDEKWIETLSQQLRAPAPSREEIAIRQARVRELSCARAAKQWEALLAELHEALL